MRVVDALKLRDNAIESNFLRDIPEDQREAARKKLRDAFAQGTTDWARRHLPAALPGVDVEEVIRRLEAQQLLQGQ